MPTRKSAGLLMYRIRDEALQVLLAHPGGPFFARKDNGHWTVPKGEIEPHEGPLQAAIREFKEEVGLEVDPQASFHDLGRIQQKGGKYVYAWAVEGDFDTAQPRPASTFEMEWPPRSGRHQRFPEVDKVEFFPIAHARIKIKDTQIPFLDKVAALLSNSPTSPLPVLR